ncbi:hypothetical protein F8E02_00120 [Methanoculleus sp. Wushi-C6]|uniref:Uncharacterized protein n=1 Tax=Methanoculleus caldifontis TaxID=2651577 RepID=A0ABU3WXI0_9EURY|nr:hypothetical protein [Methanoculleus sp. Wushi-C6]MDV2480436.1 hypothetical protein [Methanoculleus sp. Wushi-C6]
MNETILERQLSEVPSVIINATSPLGNKKAWAIYIALLQRDEGLRFNQIRDLFEAEPPEIARALRALGNAGLIARQARTLDEVGNVEASFYVPTTLGKALIAALYQGLLPSPEDEPERAAPGEKRRPARTHCPASPVRTGKIPIPASREGRGARSPVRRKESRRSSLRGALHSA